MEAEQKAKAEQWVKRVVADISRGDSRSFNDAIEKAPNSRYLFIRSYANEAFPKSPKVFLVPVLILVLEMLLFKFAAAQLGTMNIITIGLISGFVIYSYYKNRSFNEAVKKQYFMLYQIEKLKLVLAMNSVNNYIDISNQENGSVEMLSGEDITLITNIVSQNIADIISDLEDSIDEQK